MNEEMQKQISKILEMMISGIEKAGDVAGEQLPGLVDDYLSMYMIDAIPIIIPLIAGVLLISIIIFIKFAIKETKEDAEAVWMFMPITVLVLIFLMLMGSVTEDLKEIYKIKTAPKAYLIEKLRK